MQFGASWCSFVQGGSVWCKLVQLVRVGGLWCKVVRLGASWCSLVQGGAFWYKLVQGGETKIDDIAHEQTIICRQLFAGHVVGSRPMKRKKLRKKFFLPSPFWGEGVATRRLYREINIIARMRWLGRLG